MTTDIITTDGCTLLTSPLLYRLLLTFRKQSAQYVYNGNIHVDISSSGTYMHTVGVLFPNSEKPLSTINVIEVIN